MKNTHHPKEALSEDIFLLKDLQLVLLIFKKGSLKKAATELNCSISTASKRLTDMEKRFGMPLFSRHYRGLTATDEGLLIASHARRIINTLENMENDIAKSLVNIEKH